MSESTIDRTVLPIRRPPFGGVTKRTLEGCVPDWNQASHPAPPDGAPNVLVVLIDDAGFGNPSTFGGAIDTPNYTRMADEGLRYNRFHVTAVCSPTRAAMLTGRNQHRVGLRPRRRVLGPLPRLQRDDPARLRDAAADPAGERLHDRRVGKWHLTPDDQQGSSGPFNRWPTGLGFDYYWGFLGGEAGQYDPLITENQKVQGVPEGTDGKPYYFPDDMAEKAIDWLHRVRAERPDAPLVHVLRDRLQPRAAPRAARVVGQVQGQVRPGLGRRSASRRSRARRSSASSPRTPSCRRERRLPEVGLAERDARGACTRARWRPTPATRRTRTGTSAASSTRSRRWASSTTRS